MQEGDGIAIEGIGLGIHGYGLGIDVDFTVYPVNRIDLNPISI